MAELASALAWDARRDQAFAEEPAAWAAQAGTGGVTQHIQAGRDAYAVGRDQTVINALPLQERALAITETPLGPNHPDTATRLNNLAATYRALGRAADALPLEARARHIRQSSG